MRAIITALAVLLAWPVAGQAQRGPFCEPSETAALTLAVNFMELHAGAGAPFDGYPVRLFVNPSTGSWTEIVDLPGGRSCVVATESLGRGGYVVPGENL